MSQDKQIRLSAITDSPKVTTGFGNVARVLLQHFHDNGFDVHSLGTLDGEPDLKGELPYTFFPANILDNGDDIMRTFLLFLVNSRPDVIFMLYDPGTLGTYLQAIFKLQKMNLLKQVPVVVYTPIEGIPVPINTAEFFMDVLSTGGKVILYSPGAVDTVVKQFPDLENKLEWARHGLDHANFYKYSNSVRKLIRQSAGIDDKFVVGSFGVNKRTKGFDQIIYTARCLKDMNKHQDIVFYLHTSKNKPVLAGYDLERMAYDYDVDDMIIFKPEQHEKNFEYVKGIDRDKSVINGTLQGLSFIDRLNMLDCYLDLSQVEGFGLPPMEAMRCGVPTISINDGGIRSEIYQGGVLWLEPLPFRCWTTWHTGVKLALADPKDAAEAIIELKESPAGIKETWSNWAMENANKYNWLETQEKITKIIKGVVKNEMSSM